ncbi:hypothetical protein CMI47_19295 [Candidatus Pacearchaeota archaeon]|nr:hypothetical protein [Candidatus Pacearchaeota archaeon]
MKVGDLVKVRDCEHIEMFDCSCVLCCHRSSRIGLIVSQAPMNSFAVQFDFGEWRLDKFDFARGDVEVIG